MASRARARRAIAALPAALALLVAAGCGGGGIDTSVFRIRPGDCFDDPAPGRQLRQVDVTPCDQPHDNEVFATVEHPAGADFPFPGHDGVVAHAEQACPGPFAAYVGIAYAQSRFSLFPIVPSRESWAKGDRQIICALYDNEAGKLTGSVRGTAR
jgi:hypothetical protein